MWYEEGCCLWCSSCIKYKWWSSLSLLWALQIGKVGGPLSQLCGQHTALQMTVTRVWNIFLWYLSQKLYFSSRFCSTPRTCSFMSAFICLSHLSFHLHYLFLFTYAHYWISWWSGESNFFNLKFRNCFVMLFHNFYDVIPFLYCH